MRWPIQIQLLVPMLSVVVLAIALASGAGAWFGAQRARQEQEEHLRRVVATLTEARFPLTEIVLRQMSGLSRAEFVFLDENDQVTAATMELPAGAVGRLTRLPPSEAPEALGASPAVELSGRSYLSQRVPITPRGPRLEGGSLVVLYSESRLSEAMREAAYPALMAGALAVAAAMIVTTLLAQRFVRPIRRLVGQTAAIARGDFHPLPLARRDDELRDLAVSINQMTERLSHYEAEVRRNEQLRTLAQLGAGIAHQLRNAATGSRMAIELHQRHCTAAADAETLEVALRQLRLMESYLQRFLAMSRPRVQVRETVALDALVDEVAALVRPACVHAGIELTIDRPAEPLRLYGDAEDLRQLLTNLLLNAVDAASGQAGSTGPLSPSVVVALERLGPDRLALHVSDTGPGPSGAVAARLFEPFVTGKPDGTGLGLFVARQIAEGHGGTIRWQRLADRTRFTVELTVGG